jgi:hypothetical protein
VLCEFSNSPKLHIFVLWLNGFGLEAKVVNNHFNGNSLSIFLFFSSLVFF